MILGAFERMVAFRYLRARRQEGFVSVIALFSLLGIMLGVATLIIVMAVMNGFRHDLLDRILGFNGHITIYAAPGAPLDDFDHVTAKIKSVPGVTAAYPEIEGQVMATSHNHSSGILVRGVTARTIETQSLITKNLSPGALAGFMHGGLIIGSRLAFKLGVHPGELVTLISPQGTPTVFGTMPRIKAYRVAGTFNVGMYEFDSNVSFMPLSEAQVFFQLPNAVSDISVFVAHPDNVGRYDQAVAAVLGSRMRIFDWQRSNLSFFNAVEIERNVMFLILTLIIVVAAFNVISSMIMLVKDKGRDIAVLRTMGATRGMILRIFMLSGASIGIVGTALGLILGVEFSAHIEAIREFIQSIIGTNLFAPEIYFLTQIPARLDPYEVGSVVAMALALSFLATIYPSWRAARLDPVEALRYE